MKIPIEVSARHVHFDAAAWQQVFGTPVPTVGHQISQPPQFAAAERVTLIGPKGRIEEVGIVGPLRSYTQVELATTDARRLGLGAPLRDSGNLADAAELTILGPAGQIQAKAGIIQQRHIHASPEDAKQLGVTHGQEVRVAVEGPRGGVLDHVLIRVDPNFQLRLHLDTDEANAFGIASETYGTLI